MHFSLIGSLCNLRKRAVAFLDCCLTRELFFLASSGQFFSESLAARRKVIDTFPLLFVIDPSYFAWNTDMRYSSEAIDNSTLGFISMV